MKRVLIIVDPQYDFITGSLPVPGAEEAMDALADYIRENATKYESVYITLDWHPIEHTSFAPFGGEWPVHCIAYSQGAAIYQPILQAVIDTNLKVEMLTKGTEVDREEYSIFQNAASSARLNGLLADADQIDICGIAGDVCVLNTLRDAVAKLGKEIIVVLQDYAPSLDGGRQLKQWIIDNMDNG